MVKQQDEQLRAELERLQARYDFLLAAVDNLPNPIFMKDEGARFFFFNRAYAEFFDMKRSEYIGKTVLDLEYLPPEDRERYQSEDLKSIERLDVVSYDATFKAPDGEDHPSYYWSRGFCDTKNDVHGLVGEIVDLYKERNLASSLDESLAELENVNEKLKSSAEEGNAGAIYNRSVLWGKGKELIESATSTSTGSCAVMFDLDNFQKVNDKFGHLKGDEILAQFAGILRSECRSTDLPVRYGGDEFLVVLNNTTLQDAEGIAERIRARCERDLLLPDKEALTVSAGVSVIEENEDLEDSIERISALIGRAKSQGRNQVVSSL